MSVRHESPPISLSKIIPLHLVAGNVSPYAFFMAKALLERGSDPNAKEPDGLTPVHVAASWGNYETLKLLLLNGGDPWLEDVDGNTPLDLARQENHVECVELLSWWLKNADSKPTTPASNQRLAENRSTQSPGIACSSPTTFLNYKPKYFSSPLRDSPTSPFSPSSDGFRRTPITSTAGLSPKAHSSSRRILRYDDCRENNAESDGNCIGTSQREATELKFDRLPSTPVREFGRRRANDEDLRENSFYTARERSTVEEIETGTINGDDRKPDGANESEPEIIDAVRRLSLLNDGLESFSQLLNQTLHLDANIQKEALAALEMTIIEEDQEIDPRRLSECNKLTDAELRRQATNQGIDVGPITAGTRFLYVRRLAGLLSGRKVGGTQKKYFSELQAVIDGRLNEAKCRQDELQLRESFDSPLNGLARQWREGRLKMSFCYLLLDPTMTKDLPTRSATMTDSESLQTFIDAIFYIGKGKKSRSLQHLLDAALLSSETSSKNAKLDKILDLWRHGYGIISLHVFQNVIPVEAYTREAAMIDAIGLDRLCNLKRGDYYGAAANWTLGRRRSFGAYLLKLAWSIFRLEGEKQLKRDDVLKPAS